MAFQDPLRSGTAAAAPTPTQASDVIAEPEITSSEPNIVSDEPETVGYAPEGGHRHDINGSPDLLEQLRPVPRIAMHAWCDTEGVARPVIRAGEDRRMAKVTAKIEPGGIRAAAEAYQYAATPNLLIVETRAEPAQVMAELEPLAEVCDPSTKVVVIGHYNDIGLYRELIRSGISEYLVAPVSVADVIGVAASIFVDPEAEPLGRTIAFVGARGGTGASTVCHNVAFAASRLFGSEVVIADLDLPFGTANIDFDRDPTSGVAEAIADPDRLDDTYLDRLLAKCSDNLSLLAAPAMLDRTFDADGEAFTQLIDVAQRGSPTVILDVPHVWCEWTRNVLSRADEVVLVASPDLTSLRNAKNIVDTLKGMRPTDGPIKLVMNQTGMPKRPEIDESDFAGPLGVKPVASIAFDPAFFGNASNNGQMLEEADPKHEAVGAIADIAHAVTGRTASKAKAKVAGGSFLARLTRRAG